LRRNKNKRGRHLSTFKHSIFKYFGYIITIYAIGKGLILEINHGSRDPSFIHGMLLPWCICLLAALFYCYDFLLRVTPSVMIHPLMKNYGANAMQIGLLSAFYYYAYTPLQIPSGVIVDKYSPRFVLSCSALLCSLGTLIFGFVDSLSIAYIARAMMGIGSAFAFVGTLKLAAVWLPKNQFALFTGIATAIGTIGAIVTDTALSHMVFSFGWRNTIYYSGISGLILTVFLFLMIKDRPPWKKPAPPEYHSWKNIGSRTLLIFGNSRFWINGAIGAFLFLPISVFASLWGVDFIAIRYDIMSHTAATATSLVFVGAAISAPFIGWLSEHIHNRRTLIALGCISCFVFSYLLIYTTSFSLTGACILLFLIGMSTSPQVLVFAIAKDMSPPKTTGLSTAATNFMVTMGAALFQPLIGYLLDSNWGGKKTSIGTHLFSLQNYQYAFKSLLLLLILSSIFTLLLPKYTDNR
jgi:MFS family permease